MYAGFLLANTPAKQAKGFALTHPTDNGVLFTWPTSDRRVFWMKGIHTPLAVAFLNEAGILLQIDVMPPDSTPLPRFYFAHQSTRLAIEAKATWFAQHKLHVGDHLLGYYCLPNLLD